MYYYHIDDNIDGGNLEIHAAVHENDRWDAHGRDVCFTSIPIKEGTILIFNNLYCYHRVSKMKINNGTVGSRKIIAFFLINPDSKDRLCYVNNPDTSVIVTNWKCHMGQAISKWFDIQYKDLYSGTYNWLYDTIGEYMIGDRKYIKSKTDMYRKSRKVYAYEKFKKYLKEINAFGRFNFRRSDW